MLYSDSIISNNVSWIQEGTIPDTFECTAKFRYRQSDNKVTVIRLNDSEIKVIFHNTNRAIAPGQTVVIYQGDVLLSVRYINHHIRYSNLLSDLSIVMVTLDV